MKKVLYLIGMIASIAMTLGLTFKLLHWPGADELLTSGFLGFTLFYLPVVVVLKYAQSEIGAGVDQYKVLLGLASAAFTGVSAVLKILHLQGADVLLVIGALTFSFGFLPFLFFSLYREAVS
ncbi:MAG: hypothetical protein OEU76_05985 [Cyclobacteriaceae bacterium]|nr:hypothetical protein [Cyclobacteriaceae bacterium]